MPSARHDASACRAASSRRAAPARSAVLRIFLLTLLACLPNHPSAADSPDTLFVGAGKPFAKVGTALAAAKDGDCIVIGPGYYPEAKLLVAKRVALLGRGDPVLDARGGGNLLEVRANGARVEGLTLRGVGVNYLKEDGAVWINEARGVTVAGNRFEKDFFAVYGTHAVGAVVRGNTMEGLRGKEASNGNGIHFWKSDSILVEGNSIRGHRDGIYLEFTGNSVVTGNTCENNIRYGLHFMFSNGNAYRKNIFRSNGSGVAVMYSRHIEMRDNRFEQNWGAASYGLLLKSISSSVIQGNRFTRNTVAIFESTGDGNAFSENVFANNGWALRIDADCNLNTFTANTFSGNTFDVAFNASLASTNSFAGNSWDHYQGWDLDKDGIGDVPHRPVELYSAIVQTHPQAMALLRSHFITLLDALERLFPTLAPINLEDASPKMPARKSQRVIP